MQGSPFPSGRRAEACVIAMVRGRPERLFLDACALLSQELPQIGGPSFRRGVALLSSRFAEHTGSILRDIVRLMVEINEAGRRLDLRTGSGQANKDEVLLLAMVTAFQQGAHARGVEAARALLTSGPVERVVKAAQALAAALLERGLLLRPLGRALLDYFAGRSVAAAVPPPTFTGPRPRKPVLRLLESA